MVTKRWMEIGPRREEVKATLSPTSNKPALKIIYRMYLEMFLKES